MERVFEFAVNHYILVSLFVAFLLAILVLESRRGGKKISAQGAVNLINRDEAVVVDIRDRKDFNEGRITGSINIPLNSIKSRASELKKFKAKQIIVADKMGQALPGLELNGKLSHCFTSAGGARHYTVPAALT